MLHLLKFLWDLPTKGWLDERCSNTKANGQRLIAKCFIAAKTQKAKG